LIKIQYTFLVDVGWQLGLDFLAQVVQNMLRCVFDLGRKILTDQKVDVVAAIRKVLRPVTIIDQVLKVLLIVIHVQLPRGSYWDSGAHFPKVRLDLEITELLFILLGLSFLLFFLGLWRHS
jgi:hypothetical protein